ncbi:MAG: helix-turn-helix domain-containing protein [Actinomycetota bacterium]
MAEWMISWHLELGGTPARQLVEPETRQAVLELAHRSRDEMRVADGEESVLARSGVLELLRGQRADEHNAQTAILLVAAELFSRHGPAKVSLRSVAAAAGVPYSLIYRFYRTKEKLLLSVMELLVRSGGRSLSEEPDAYTAIANTFDADAGQWDRMVSWAILEGTNPTDLFSGGFEAGGYRKHIEHLWDAPHPPAVRERFNSRVVASLIMMVSGAWASHEPYLTAVSGEGMPDAAAQKAEIIELLQLLVWAARPGARSSVTALPAQDDADERHVSGRRDHVEAPPKKPVAARTDSSG